MLGPLGCGLQTGAGAVLNVMQPAAGLMAARIAGCDPIIAVDRLPSRLARGRSHRGELHYDSSRTQVGIASNGAHSRKFAGSVSACHTFSGG